VYVVDVVGHVCAACMYRLPNRDRGTGDVLALPQVIWLMTSSPMILAVLMEPSLSFVPKVRCFETQHVQLPYKPHFLHARLSNFNRQRRVTR
jgi:hypothetical protein